MEFILSKLVFSLEFKRAFSSPFVLFGIRKAFQEAFRRTVCGPGQECDTCPPDGSCSYRDTFSQALADDPSAVKRHQKPPLPFAFAVPVLPAKVYEGESAEISLTLAGSAVNFAEDYVSAVTNLFQNDPVVMAEVREVWSEDCSGFRHSVAGKGKRARPDFISTISANDLAEMSMLHPNRLRVSMMTPARILSDGRALRSFSFSPFIRSLLRRVSSLAYYYYRGGVEADYKWLASLSAGIRTGHDDTCWQEPDSDREGSRYGGLVGSAVFEGELSDFHLFLLLGEYFNVGKGSSFGLGRYRIDRT
jgi:hypothetical protein